MDTRPFLAIITARGGSKRLPGKNLLPLRGKPLIAWSILAAQAAPSVGAIYVSTDCAEIQSVSAGLGARCPDLRSPELSTDTATSAAVVHDVLDRLAPELDAYAGLVLLQPTSPLRQAQDIEAAIALYRQGGAQAVVSVCEAECPAPWVGQLSEDGMLDSFVRPEFKGRRSQDLGLWYRFNGAVYVIGFAAFRAENGFMPKGTRASIMPRHRSVDIDTAVDLRIAEALADWPSDGTYTGA
ncbi:cytidylyltransferase domain-containing protein [Pannonibacter sp. I15F10I1]|uniref:acylneuraminate cytidylyltransferase family protein n=1 Tax=Pannonibacter sp. I15F10I1 TaxID=2003580 RepID=UPI0016497111|nr:acylneuraminate cytidylyltransferase family protein [Pannonibacter sp. I15F10I1]